MEEGIGREFGMDMYTLLYLKYLKYYKMDNQHGPTV